MINLFEPLQHYIKAHDAIMELKKDYGLLLSEIKSSKTPGDLIETRKKIETYRWVKDKFGNLKPEVAQTATAITSEIHYIDDLFSMYESKLAFLNSKSREEFDEVYAPFRNELDNITYNHFKGKFSVISIKTAEKITELKESFDEFVMSNELSNKESMGPEVENKIKEINLSYFVLVDNTKKAIRYFAPYQTKLKNVNHIKHLIESGEIEEEEILTIWKHYKELEDIFFIV